MSSSITFEELESNTYSALAFTSRLRRSLQSCSAPFYLLWATHLLKKVPNLLRSADLQDLDPKEVATFIANVEHLYRINNALVKTTENKRMLFHRWFAPIASVNEEIGDWLETYHLSMNKDFRELVETSIRELKFVQEPSDWRSSLAQMQD